METHDRADATPVANQIPTSQVDNATPRKPNNQNGVVAMGDGQSTNGSLLRASTVSTTSQTQSPAANPIGQQTHQQHPPNPPSQMAGLVCNIHRTTGREPHALVGASTTIIGDRLFVFGGRKLSQPRPILTSDLYVLDLLRRHWTKIKAKGEIPSPRYFHSVCALGDRKLVCYGGMSPEPTTTAATATNSGSAAEAPEAGSTVMSDIHMYEISTQTWTKVNSTNTPQGRYAHCAAILPSSAVYTTTSNQADRSNAAPVDGSGGAEMIVVGGQDSSNSYIEQISIFNLRSLQWTSTAPTNGRSCGAYRSVVTPLTTMAASQVGAEGGSSLGLEKDEEQTPKQSGSPLLIYTNYNFLDVKLELQVRLPNGTTVEQRMRNDPSPPGLRFPSGGVINNHLLVAGTFLTQSTQEFALWALDLRTLQWAKIDVASDVFSSGSWNRGVLWNRRNAFVVLGNKNRSLTDDYSNRRLNFTNICLVHLEAFGLYDNVRRMTPFITPWGKRTFGGRCRAANVTTGGFLLGGVAEELGEAAAAASELADMEIMTLEGTRVPVNSRFLSRRWGPHFNNLLQDANPAHSLTETATLRPGTANDTARTPSVISFNDGNANGINSSTLRNLSTPGMTDVSAIYTNEPAETRGFPARTRPRILYLPHTIQTIHCLLHFLYTSSLPPNNSPLANTQVLCSLLPIAKPYGIEGLIEAVLERLHFNLDGRNAAAIFNAAAMSAGGGHNYDNIKNGTTIHPPRKASLAGANMMNGESVTDSTGIRNVPRINTNMTNGNDHHGDTEEDEDDEKAPESAVSTISIDSQLQGDFARPTPEVWPGGWSAVIGLQKRGLRGLMEGRRMRELDRASIEPTSAADIPSPGIVSGPAQRVGLGIA